MREAYIAEIHQLLSDATVRQLEQILIFLFHFLG